MLKGLNLAGAARPALPNPKPIDVNSSDFAKVVETETHIADADIAITDAMLDSTPAESIVEIHGDEENITDKLSRLVDDDFPFDESQLMAVTGLVKQTYGCLIGAAGTGKTTVTKKLVDMLRDGLKEVDMSKYWQRGAPEEHDDYEAPQKLIPSIVMVSFTRRASQMTKKNFPRDWHGNVMTIHRALGFYPEFYPAYDEESGQMKNKRQFVPSYTDENQMPWDIVIIDEAGMLGLDLWHQLWAACKPGCRVYMIGDINQLPPTHGKSVLGFALASWPTWELTHIHRQQGANNSIVDNAHRVLKGLRPVSDSTINMTLAKSDKDMLDALNFMVKEPDWRFATVEIPEDHRKASLRIRQMLKLLQGKFYEPNRDVIITPINGYEQTAPGYSLGQAPMNQELVISLNRNADRYFIDAGRERQNFAEGDKVMATVNDYEAGVTNGMTGIVTSIAENGAYTGDLNRFGLITEVNDYLAGLTDRYDDEDVEFSLEEMVSDEELGAEQTKDKEKKDSGPASHIVTVRFGEGEHAFEINFASKSQVASLMLAYVATCHKMQGGECPLVFVIVHNANKRPLNREWLYTAITRASQRCVVLYTKQGLGFALGKQNIKGTTLEQKVKTFVELTKSGLVGAAVKVKLPNPVSLTGEIVPLTHMQKAMTYEEAKPPAFTAATREESPRVEAERIPSAAPLRPIHIKIGAGHIHQAPAESKPAAAATDGGVLRAAPRSDDRHGVLAGLNRGRSERGVVDHRVEDHTATRIEPRQAQELSRKEFQAQRDKVPGAYAELLTALLALPAPRVIHAYSKPFDGKPVEQLTHDAFVASLSVPAPTPAPVAPKVHKPLGLAALLAKQGIKS